MNLERLFCWLRKLLTDKFKKHQLLTSASYFPSGVSLQKIAGPWADFICITVFKCWGFWICRFWILLVHHRIFTGLCIFIQPGLEWFRKIFPSIHSLGKDLTMGIPFFHDQKLFLNLSDFWSHKFIDKFWKLQVLDRKGNGECTRF